MNGTKNGLKFLRLIVVIVFFEVLHSLSPTAEVPWQVAVFFSLLVLWDARDPILGVTCARWAFVFAGICIAWSSVGNPKLTPFVFFGVTGDWWSFGIGMALLLGALMWREKA